MKIDSPEVRPGYPPRACPRCGLEHRDRPHREAPHGQLRDGLLERGGWQHRHHRRGHGLGRGEVFGE